MGWSTEFPAPLARLHELEFDFDVMDFEPYDEFWPSSENSSWLQAWTGNEAAESEGFRVFGMDGTGGQVAFWLANDGAELLDQPVVFLGSEGETGVVACDFGDYLWLLAGGIGPKEAVEYGADEAKPQQHFEDFAREVAPEKQKMPAEVLALAKAKHPGFEAWIDSMCR